MTTTATRNKYIETVGRRKTATARIRLTPSSKNSYSINGKDLQVYFPTDELRNNAVSSFAESKTGEHFSVSIVVNGGGISAQSDAIRLGIARALIENDKELRGRLKKAGHLKRDPRAKERRKFGFKKARKSPQWSKR